MNSFPIIRVVAKLIIPYILLFGLYVQFHGDFGPGGGFQAGVIMASALILYGLVFGLPAVEAVAPSWLIEKLIAVGLLIYAGTGWLTTLLGRDYSGSNGPANFLDYEALNHHVGEGFLPHGQHLGLLLIELGVGITVTSVMTIIFYCFAGHAASSESR